MTPMHAMILPLLGGLRIFSNLPDFDYDDDIDDDDDDDDHYPFEPFLDEHEVVDVDDIDIRASTSSSSHSRHVTRYGYDENIPFH